MTEYNSMSHQQLYDYVFSGSPSNVESEATLNQSHGKSVTEATTDLSNTLAKIQASWSGAAADEFTQQTNSIVQQMQIHAEAADTVHTWMNYASQYLTWAQQNMPSPPSSAEQDLADVNKNSVSEWGIGILTGGTSYLASNAAQEDIANKKTAAVSVMTQLASAYGTANSNLTSLSIGGGTDHTKYPPPGGGSNSGQGGSGSSSASNGSNASAAGMVLPMTMAMQGAAGGYSGGNSGDSGSTSRVPTGSSYTSGSGSSSGTTSGGTGTGTGTSGSGVTDSKLPTTVTSGLGDLPTTGTTPGSSGYSGLGTTTGSGASGSGSGGLGSLGGLGAGGLSEFGGSGAAGLGSGGLSAEGEGSYGSTGLSASSGSGKSAALSGGTGTGELGEEAGGTGYGSQAGAGSSTAAAAAGEAEGTGSTGQSGMMGGMGGMGHGGGGGGQEERGNRASWLKEDPDYWYSDKMKNAAPPGGVIE